MNIDTTRHAIKRAKERCGLPRRAVARTALIAFQRGWIPEDREWTASDRLSITSSRLILRYGNFNYIYELCAKQPILITIVKPKR